LARTRIYVRPLDSVEARELQGTEGAYRLTYSPDGKWIAFTTHATEGSVRTALMKVQVSGGPPVMLYEQAEGQLSLPTWAWPDSIVVQTGKMSTQVSLVSADGGQPRVIWDTVKAGLAELPQSLAGVPGGKFVLMTVAVADEKGWRQRSMILSVASGEAAVLQDEGSFPLYAEPGCVLYTIGASLMARPFDAQTGKFTGPATPLLSGLRTSQSYNSALWDHSAGGTLAYMAGGNFAGQRRLATVDATGKVEPLSKATGDFESSAAMSPDGKLVCGSIVSEAGTYEVFVCDLATDSVRRLPVLGDAIDPMWMPDGRSVVYSTVNTASKDRIVLRRIDGSDAGTTLYETKEKGEYLSPCCVSGDGAWVLCRHVGKDRVHARLVAVSTGSPPQSKELFEGEDLGQGYLSPDGKWIAVAVLEGGRSRLLIRPNPLSAEAAERAGMSAALPSQNGSGVIWSPDGGSIWFVEGRGRVRAVDVKTEPTLSVSPARDLFDWDMIDSASSHQVFTPDGKKMAFVLASENEVRFMRVNIVLHWGQELRAKVGVK
jgi:Tol biopolymer transport system component